MTRCPECGGPGGVRLLTSVAPCNRCGVARAGRARPPTGYLTSADLGAGADDYAAALVSRPPVATGRWAAARERELARVSWGTRVPVVTFATCAAGLVTDIDFYRRGVLVARSSQSPALAVLAGQEVSTLLGARVEELLYAPAAVAGVARW